MQDYLNLEVVIISQKRHNHRHSQMNPQVNAAMRAKQLMRLEVEKLRVTD